MDSNGYNKSLFDTEDGECYICGFVGDTARHEVIYGTGNRAQSKKYGLWVALCPRCHQRVHANQKEYEWLKEKAYNLFCEEHSREFFYKIYRRYY